MRINTRQKKQAKRFYKKYKWKQRAYHCKECNCAHLTTIK